MCAANERKTSKQRLKKAKLKCIIFFMIKIVLHFTNIKNLSMPTSERDKTI